MQCLIAANFLSNWVIMSSKQSKSTQENDYMWGQIHNFQKCIALHTTRQINCCSKPWALNMLGWLCGKTELNSQTEIPIWLRTKKREVTRRTFGKFPTPWPRTIFLWIRDDIYTVNQRARRLVSCRCLSAPEIRNCIRKDAAHEGKTRGVCVATLNHDRAARRRFVLH